MKLILSLLTIFLVIQHYEFIKPFLNAGTGIINKVIVGKDKIPMAEFRFTVKNLNSNRTTKITFFVVNEISGEVSWKGDSKGWKVTDVRKTNLDAGRYKKYEDILMNVLKDLDTHWSMENPGGLGVLKALHSETYVWF